MEQEVVAALRSVASPEKQQKEAGLRALAELAQQPSMRTELAAHPKLLGAFLRVFLGERDGELATHAVLVLYGVAADPSTCPSIATPQVLARLSELLDAATTQPASLVEAIVDLLQRLVKDQSSLQAVLVDQMLVQRIVDRLDTSNYGLRNAVMQLLCALLSPAAGQYVTKCQSVLCRRGLQSLQHTLKMHAVLPSELVDSALTLMFTLISTHCSTSDTVKRVLVASGTIAPLVEVVTCQDSVLRDHALLVLIALTTVPETSATAQETGLVAAAVAVVTNTALEPAAKRASVVLLRTLLRANPTVAEALELTGFCAATAGLLAARDPKIVVAAAEALGAAASANSRLRAECIQASADAALQRAELQVVSQNAPTEVVAAVARAVSTARAAIALPLCQEELSASPDSTRRSARSNSVSGKRSASGPNSSPASALASPVSHLRPVALPQGPLSPTIRVVPTRLQAVSTPASPKLGQGMPQQQHQPPPPQQSTPPQMAAPAAPQPASSDLDDYGASTLMPAPTTAPPRPPAAALAAAAAAAAANNDLDEYGSSTPKTPPAVLTSPTKIALPQIARPRSPMQGQYATLATTHRHTKSMWQCPTLTPTQAQAIIAPSGAPAAPSTPAPIPVPTAAPTSPAAPSSPTRTLGGPARMSVSQKRRNIAMEILETERSFVQSLEQCITRYLKVLRGPRADVLPPESVDKLFGNLEDVFQHNRRFLHLLEGQMNNWTEQTRIGATFDCYWEGYTTQIYSEYANNCDEAIALYYSLLEGTPAFRAFVQEVQKAGGMDLASYLIMPIQRLPRYMLLLQRLLQATPHMHPDVSNIQRAYTSAKAVTDDINTRKKRSEEMKKLKQVADSIDGLPPNLNIVEPKRCLIKKGSVEDRGGKPRTLYLVLTTDILVIAQPTRKKMKYVKHAALEGVTASVTMSPVTDTLPPQKVLLLVFQDATFMLAASSAAECDQWASEVQAAKARRA